MIAKNEFFICPMCFRICDADQECHQHRTLRVDAGPPGDARRQPVNDRFGRMVSRAPRWYLEATGRIPAWTPLRS
jgi:hypothetical protein